MTTSAIFDPILALRLITFPAEGSRVRQGRVGTGGGGEGAWTLTLRTLEVATLDRHPRGLGVPQGSLRAGRGELALPRLGKGEGTSQQAMLPGERGGELPVCGGMQAQLDLMTLWVSEKSLTAVIFLSFYFSQH